MGIVKECEPCDQSAVSEGRPLEVLQERSDTYPGWEPWEKSAMKVSIATTEYMCLNGTPLVRVSR